METTRPTEVVPTFEERQQPPWVPLGAVKGGYYTFIGLTEAKFQEDESGLHNRPDELGADLENVIERLRVGRGSLRDYQLFAQSWLLRDPAQPGSIDRLKDKVVEEVQEFEEALHSGGTEDVMSEAGDVLWTTTSLFSAANLELNTAMRDRIRYYRESAESAGGFDPQNLDERYRKLLEQVGPYQFFIADFDRILQSPFMPLAYQEQWTNDQIDEQVSAALIKTLAGQIVDNIENRHHFHAQLQGVSDPIFANTGTGIISERNTTMQHAVAELWLLVGHACQRYATLSEAAPTVLTDAVQLNVEKLLSRVDNGALEDRTRRV